MNTPRWNVTLLTLFPEMFPGSLGHSLAGSALKKNIWNFNAVNIRDYAKDKHKNVDDTPAGGGAGMVIRADVLGDAIDQNVKKGTKIIYMSPRGQHLTQKKCYELANQKEIAIICGRFEGIDERIIDHYEVEEVSIGDYILSGGEVAASVLMDSCIRLLDGVLGNSKTLEEESFGENDDYAGLLEYPLYTRPVKWRDLSIPDVLFSGHHAKIRQWRLEQAEKITKQRRADLWNKYKTKD